MRYAVQTLQSLGQSDGKYDYCTALLQQRLLEQGSIPSSARTGIMNDETNAAMEARYGKNWERGPGGICAISAALLTQPNYSYVNPNQTFGVEPSTLWLVGGGLLLFTLVLASR